MLSCQLVRAVRLGALALLSCSISSAAAQGDPYGIDAPAAIGAYLNDAFGDRAPGASDQYDLAPAYPALTFDQPLVITPHPNAATMFVANRDGRIFSFDDDPNVASMTTFLDLRSRCAVVWDGGLMGFVPHPNYGVAGAVGSDEVFAFYCYTPTSNYPSGVVSGFFDCYLRLSRFTVPAGSQTADETSEEVMIQLRMYNSSHRGGHLAFGPDGMLYVPVGDQFRSNTAQDIWNNFDGGVHRIDVDRDPAQSHAPVRTLPLSDSDEISGVGYWIPNDNPFVDPSGTRFEEYWSLGHRNPHRMSFDSVTGEIWVGEVGSNRRDELNIIEPSGNYGWPFREGFGDGILPPPSNPVGNVTEPVLDFLRSEAISIIGGGVYRGMQHPSLIGRYICADYLLNRIYAVDYDATTDSYTKEVIGIASPGETITFGETTTGELCFGRQSSSTTLQTLRGTNPGPDPPAMLSGVGAFSDLQTLTPAPGLIPYGLQSPFWSDGARKRRWVAIPNNGTHNAPAEQIEFDRGAGDWKLPPGSVTVKHFDLPVDDTDPTVTRRLETRFLIFTDDGTYGVSYRWLPDGSDAVLVTGSQEESIDIATGGRPRTQVWTYPGPADCAVCHTPETRGALGLRTHQLNGDFTYPASGVVDNQLRTFSHLGIFKGGLDEADIAGLPMAAASEDQSASLDVRARSYLDSNCAHCHRPDSATRATFDARFDTPLYSADLLFGQVTENLGVDGAQVVAPRDVHRSIALLRASALDGTAMPPIAKSVVDETGVALLTDWVRQLEASEHRRLGNLPERLELLDAWASNLVINTTDVYTNDTGATVDLRLESFRFWASDVGSAITPFLAEVTGPDQFIVRAVGHIRRASEYTLGHNTFPFTGASAPSIRVDPGVSIAMGFIDAFPNGGGGAAGSVVAYCICNGADDVWITGGPTGADSASIASGSPPTQGTQTLTGLQRDYSFAIDVVIEEVNAAPVWMSVPDVVLDAGAEVDLQVLARDDADDIVMYQAEGLPSELALNPETGEITGTLLPSTTGTHPVTLTASDGRDAASEAFDLIVSPFDAATLDIVVEGVAALPDGTSVTTSDVVRLNLTNGKWSVLFDGSDVGVGTPISGLCLEPDGSLLLAFERALNLPSLTGGPSGTRVEPNDIVRFQPQTLGDTTAGQFEFVFNGSDVMFLHDDGSHLDAITRLPDGRLAFSTKGRATVAGTPVRDEDLVAFTGTLGASTLGTAEVVFDGSELALAGASEDVDAASVLPTTSELLLSFRAQATVGAGIGFSPVDLARYVGSLSGAMSGAVGTAIPEEGLGRVSPSQVRALSIR